MKIRTIAAVIALTTTTAVAAPVPLGDEFSMSDTMEEAQKPRILPMSIEACAAGLYYHSTRGVSIFQGNISYWDGVGIELAVKTPTGTITHMCNSHTQQYGIWHESFNEKWNRALDE